MTKLSESYKLWYPIFCRLPRLTRFTLGAKIDNLFTDALKQSLTVSYAPQLEKLKGVQKLSEYIDYLKLFLKLLWEIKALEDKKYILLSVPLTASGKMVGGWLNMLKNK